jgi:inorganic pyrophosphatase
MDCRLIGALKAEQTERDGRTMRNDRLLAVPMVSQLYSQTSDISDLPEAIVNQLEHFFRNYNEQAGKEFKILERLGAAAASELI